MITAKHVTKNFRSSGFRHSTELRAVSDVSLSIEEGRIYALVGESGSGKTTLAHLLLGLQKPEAGGVYLDGQSILSIKPKERFRQIQLVLQDGKSALDPAMSVGQSIAEPMLTMKLCDRKTARQHVESLLHAVDLAPEIAKRKPAELSGGEQKRVCIARALCVKPRFIFFDEATAGLDVIRREQVLVLICNLQREYGFTSVFITHDLEVALHTADTIHVMKGGRIVETLVRPFAPENVQHPYTQILMREFTDPVFAH